MANAILPPLDTDRAVLLEAYFDLSDEALGLAYRYLAEHPVAPVSFQKRKGFKKCIGTYLAGIPKPKIFWLGHDKTLAGKLAAFIVAVHRALQHDGMTYWTEGALIRPAGRNGEGEPGDRGRDPGRSVR